MAVDALMRKLKIPPKFVPYLEKHRIYELFYDLGNELAMSQPEDPISFIKECLENLYRVRDKRLLIIIAPFHFDRIQLAKLIAAKTSYGMLSRYIMCGKTGQHQDPSALAKNTAEHIQLSDKGGWILVDYPKTKSEAKILIKHKVIPTHAFYLSQDGSVDLNEGDKYRKSIQSLSDLTESEINMLELKEMFKASLSVVNVNNRSLQDIADLCSQLTTTMTARRAPRVFRVVLIGPRGSRRRTIAKLLQEKYNLVHVDMFQLINAARRLKNSLGDEIKRIERFGIPYSNKLIFDLLKSRIRSKDCLERGYVLTNYPRSRADFVLLDSTDTPPNKVIFFNVESDFCRERLGDRVVNMYTGEVHSKKSISGNPLLKDQTLTHPEDDLCVVEEDLKFYDKHVTDLLDYCGDTAYVINNVDSMTDLLVKVEGVLMSPAPTVKPRPGTFDKKSSSCDSGLQIRSIATPYPLPRSTVVPLIDSEELLCRFRELKKTSEDFEKYTKSSISRSEQSYCICDELSKCSLTNVDLYCTCDEPQIVGEHFYCTCDGPLIDEDVLLFEHYCTCEETLLHQ